MEYTRQLLLTFIIILSALVMSACSDKEPTKTITMEIPIGHFGTKTIESPMRLESGAGGGMVNAVFKINETFSFHGGFRVKVTADGSIPGEWRDEGGEKRFYGMGKVIFSFSTIDQIGVETVEEISQTITINHQEGDIYKGILMTN